MHSCCDSSLACCRVSCRYVTVIPLVAGRHRHLCFYLQLADVMALTQFDPYDPAYCVWMFPEMRRANQPAKIIGDYIKHVNKKHKDYLPQYKEMGVAADGLPETANAAGIRPGACTTLFSQMPDNMAIALTGHDMTGFSRYHEYIDVNVANCMVPAMVLAGWNSPGWGERSIGPRPASLRAIVQHGVTMETLDYMIDELFRFHSATPPMLLRDGSLRELPRTSFASLVMYHVERQQAGEMFFVQARLYDVARSAFPGQDVANLLNNWATWVRHEFARDNAHLTAREEDGATRGLAKCIADLGQEVGELRLTFNGIPKVVGAISHAMNGLVDQVKLSLLGGGGNANDEEMDVEDGGARAIVEEPEEDAHSRALMTSGRGMASVGAESMAMAVAVVEPPPSAFNALQRTPAHVANAPGEADNAKADNATLFYLNTMAKGGEMERIGLEKQDVNRRRLVLTLYNAMATDEEQAFLKSRDSEYGERLRMVTDLTDLVLKRLSKIFEGYGAKLPTLLRPPDKKSRGVKNKAPPISFFDNSRNAFVKHCKTTNKCTPAHANGLFTEPDRATVQRWRSEAKRGGEWPVVAPPELPTVPPQGGGIGAFFNFRPKT